jgi:hypothetical protein
VNSEELEKAGVDVSTVLGVGEGEEAWLLSMEGEELLAESSFTLLFSSPPVDEVCTFDAPDFVPSLLSDESAAAALVDEAREGLGAGERLFAGPAITGLGSLVVVK